jgi:dihydroorotate dehydrogenase/NAD-dependent dihydropyrimidine dehydrogenase PreA subunit
MANEKKVDISVDLCGIRMKNPLIVAAGPYGRSGHVIKDITIPRADPVGAVETKLIACRWLPPMARYMGPAVAWAINKVGPWAEEKYPSEGYSAVGMAYGMKLSAEDWLDDEFAIAVKAGKEAGVPIFVNGPAPMLDPFTLDMFGTTEDKEIERMAELASKFEQQGAAAVQALFHLASSPGYAWQNWSMMPKIMSLLKKAVKIPVIAKAIYHPSFAEQVAKPLEDAGADAIICTGFVRSSDVDIELARPSFAAFSGDVEITGAHQKPAALTCIADSANAGIKIPLIGGGGVNSARDVIAFVMLGASCVQLVTAAMFKGLSLFKRIDRDVRSWLDAHGYRSLDDIRGIALEKYGDLELKSLEKIRVEIDETRCDGCGICARYCLETSVGAISIEEGVAKIDQEKCVKCTFCALLCPSEKQAISVKGWPSEG